MSQALPPTVEAEINAACEAAGVTLIDLEVKGQHRQLRLNISIDTEDGVLHEHCRTVSREIDERLAEDEFFDRVAAVDVSSPGAEALVKFLWQLKKHVGRTVHVERTDGTAIEGKLVAVTDAGLDVQQKGTKKQPGQTQSIPSADISSARTVISFR